MDIHKKSVGTILVSATMFLAACGSGSETVDSLESEEGSETQNENSESEKESSDKGEESETGDSANGNDEASAAAIEIEGDQLEQFSRGGQDPAVGVVAPTLRGKNFDGDELTIEADGKKKAVYFLAHWCGHCQQEVPMVQELLDDGELPDDLEIYSVSTLERPGTAVAPQEWLEGENWTPPVLLDDSDSSAFEAYGATGTPFVVYLDGDNKVIKRSSGSTTKDVTLTDWKSVSDS